MQKVGAMRDPILSIEGLSKRFCRDFKRSLWYGFEDIWRELSTTRRDVRDLRTREFWALKDISFDVERGECVGLVGSNGAGKTTLLRIISGLIKPDAGSVTVKGVTAPLLALGAGFNPILTGRENVFTNMAILGVEAPRILELFDEVVAFAELEDAIDAPVASYSSGMTARLGFACAVFVMPDVLIVDEVLSVGDMRFRAKCYRKLAEVREAGTSILLVSHNSGALMSICDRVAYLSKGRLIEVGDTAQVMSRYENDLFSKTTIATNGEVVFEPDRNSSSNVAFKRIYLTGPGGNNVAHFTTGQLGAFHIDVQANAPQSDVSALFIIRDVTDQEKIVLHLSNSKDKGRLDLPIGKSTISLALPGLGLRPGNYIAKIALTASNFFMLDAIEAFSFAVSSEQNFTSNVYYQPREWKVHGCDDTIVSLRQAALRS